MSPEQALLQQLSGEITRLHRSVVELSEAVSKLAESVPEKAAQDVPSTRSNANVTEDINCSKSTYKGDPGNWVDICEWVRSNHLDQTLPTKHPAGAPWGLVPIVREDEINLMMSAVSHDDFERGLREILLRRVLTV